MAAFPLTASTLRAFAAAALRVQPAVARTNRSNRGNLTALVRGFSSAVSSEHVTLSDSAGPSINAEVSRYVRPDQTELRVSDDGRVLWNGLDLNNIAKVYGTPLKLTYVPAVAKNVAAGRDMFHAAMERHGYQGKYRYCYCTKSNHFRHAVEEAVKSGAGLEFSSAADINVLLRSLRGSGLLQLRTSFEEMPLLCNGHKPADYIAAIVSARALGFRNVLPILDSADELFNYLDNPALFLPAANGTSEPLKVGIRLQMSSAKPGARSSRFGFPLEEAVALCREEIATRGDEFELTMMHCFPRSGVKDTPDFWAAVDEAMDAYIALKEVCPTLNSLNMGGGMPFANSFATAANDDANADAVADPGSPATQARVLDGLVLRVMQRARAAGIPEPHLYTEFGSFTVANTSVNIFEVTASKGASTVAPRPNTALARPVAVAEKKESDATPPWYIIDSSFVVALPDAWACNHRFDVLPLNHLDKDFSPVVLGGLTCDEDDFYGETQHGRPVCLPNLPAKGTDEEPLRVAFFNTGAYQDNLAGIGGLQHCMMEAPQQLLARVIDGDFSSNNGNDADVVAAVKLAGEVVHVNLPAPERKNIEAAAAPVTVEVSSYSVHDPHAQAELLGYAESRIAVLPATALAIEAQARRLTASREVSHFPQQRPRALRASSFYSTRASSFYSTNARRR